MRRQRVWITKWALTKGIIEIASAEISVMSGTEYASSANSGPYRIFTREFATTLESAKQIARDMAKRRIQSLRKSITKLEKFEPFLK